MGEHAYYRVNGVETYALRNRTAAFPYAMEVFSLADWVDEARGLALGEGFPRPEEDEGFLGFRTNCAVARRRLDVQGYTLCRSFEAFRRCAQELESALEEEPECDDEGDWDYDDDSGFEYNRFDVKVELDSIIAVLMEPDSVIEAYRQVFNEETMLSDHWHRSDIVKTNAIKGINPYADVLIESSPYGLLGVIPLVNLSPLYELRVILEVVPESSAIEYDCGMVLRYWDADIELYLKEHLEAGPMSESCKTVILTEGITDDEFLKGSLNLLMPEVSHLFRFFGYHAELSPERSADSLMKLAKAMASVGLAERFVFLFDNDAVGMKCWSQVKDSLPPNMTAIRLPDTEVAKAYPTYGPQGCSTADINGHAVTIELFLGQNALTGDDGELRLVQWGQQVNGVYQAGFPNDEKREIQDSFRTAVARAKQDGLSTISYDWSGMQSLLDYICENSSSLPPVMHDSLLLHV